MSQNERVESWASTTPRFSEIQDNLVNQLFEALRDNWGIVASSQLKRLALSFEHHTQLKATCLNEYIQLFSNKIRTHGKELNLNGVLSLDEQRAVPEGLDHDAVHGSNAMDEGSLLTEAHEPIYEAGPAVNVSYHASDPDVWSNSGALLDFSGDVLSTTDDKLTGTTKQDSPESDALLLDYLMSWPDLMYQYNESLGIGPDYMSQENSSRSEGI